MAPPRTVGSWAVMRHSTPSTTPMPVTDDAPTVYSVPQPASAQSSRKAVSGSSKSSIRSRANSFPRSWWRVTYRSPPPARATASCSSTCATASVRARSLARKTSEFGSMVVVRTGIWVWGARLLLAARPGGSHCPRQRGKNRRRDRDSAP